MALQETLYEKLHNVTVSLFCNVQMRLDTLSFRVKSHLGCVLLPGLLD